MKITKDYIQQKAMTAWRKNRCRGLIAAATGVGKSRLGVLAAQEVFALHGENTDIVLVAPYRELLEVGWPEEFKNWGARDILPYITFVTYTSFNKLPKKKRSLIILDEGHHLTERSAEFFHGNVQDRIIALSATPPVVSWEDQIDGYKPPLLRVAPVVFEYTLKQACADGLVADYQIWVVNCYLEDTKKTVLAGPPKNQFLTTEKANYEYITKKIKQLKDDDKYGSLQAVYGNRMRFLYNLRSKFEVAKRILARIPPTERTIIFCGSIKQAEAIAGKNVYHSKSGRWALEAFKNEEINFLAVIKALDEGHNIPNVDNEIIIQATSVARQTLQRIGRSIRFRVGHRARIFLLRAQGTVDVKWVESTLDEFDNSKIKYYDSSKL